MVVPCRSALKAASLAYQCSADNDVPSAASPQGWRPGRPQRRAAIVMSLLLVPSRCKPMSDMPSTVTPRSRGVCRPLPAPHQVLRPRVSDYIAPRCISLHFSYDESSLCYFLPVFLTSLVPFVLFFCIPTGRQKPVLSSSEKVINMLFTPSSRSAMKMSAKTGLMRMMKRKTVVS